MSLNDNQIQLLQKFYNDESLGLTTEKKLYDYLKTNGETGYTLSKIKEFLKSLEVNQVLTRRCLRVSSTMVLNIYLLVWMYLVKKQI